jgi:acyl-coenzyme A thioesterase PaaI-like protein
MGDNKQRFPGSVFGSGDWVNGFGLRIERDDEWYSATYTFADHQQGPPRIAHGGAIATVLDELMTAAVYESVHMPTYTVNLNVNYRAPVLLGAPVQIQARVDRTDGRKLFAVAIIRSADAVVLAEATGLFVMAQNAIE